MIAPSPDLICPTCNGGFIEELEIPNPNPNPNPNPFDNVFLAGGFPLLFSDTSGRRSPEDPDAFNPFHFLQNYLQALVAGGANVQFVLDNQASDGAGDGVFRLPAWSSSSSSNLGDYFIGPGLEQLIQQLAENDPNRYGTPPASKAAVEALPDVQVSGEDLDDSDSAQCAVCKDEFEPGEAAKRMPCRHVYHPDCILPWLALHNSCPVCRYELPTDDQDYERRAQGTGVAQPNLGNSALAALLDSGGTASEENSPRTQSGERRLRISLPWPFRAFGSPAEASNSGVGGNSSNNEGGANVNSQGSGDQGNRDSPAESRQEGLD